jgi:hypothetical protein
MNNTTATKPSVIYIEKVENLHIDNIELATANIYIEKVEDFHIGKTEPVTTGKHEQPSDPCKPLSGINDLTNSQLVLFFYYLLGSWGIWPRGNADMASIARAIHLITGKSYKQVNNSEFYKKLKQAPNFKTDKWLIKDLEVVKGVFLQVELKAAALLVDNELKTAHQEINRGSK